jgi:hypothetical protein
VGEWSQLLVENKREEFRRFELFQEVGRSKGCG